jgi:hypothetical protein
METMTITALDLAERRLLVALADGDHDDHRGDAQDNAQAGQGRPQQVQPQVLEAQEDRLQQEVHRVFTA